MEKGATTGGRRPTRALPFFWGDAEPQMTQLPKAAKIHGKLQKKKKIEDGNPVVDIPSRRVALLLFLDPTDRLSPPVQQISDLVAR